MLIFYRKRGYNTVQMKKRLFFNLFIFLYESIQNILFCLVFLNVGMLNALLMYDFQNLSLVSFIKKIIVLSLMHSGIAFCLQLPDRQ